MSFDGGFNPPLFQHTSCKSRNPRWTWAVTTALFLAIMALSLALLAMKNAEDETLELSQLSPVQQQMATHQDFDDVRDIVLGRCAMCHAAEPYYEGGVMGAKTCDA